MEEITVKNKTVIGAWWSLLDNIARYGVSFVISIVLARLLSPTEYGLIGIVSIFIAVFNSFVDCGFSTALIRNNKAGEIEYSTVFFANLAISLLLFIILELLAPIIALFFEYPELCSLTRVMGFIIIINALSLVPKTKLTVCLDFKTQTKITLISSISSGIIGIIMAYTGCRVWSLVAQQLCNQIISTILLWLFNKWMPKCLFSQSVLKEMFSFGWKLLVIGLINTLWNEMYQIVIGKCYKPATLGQFTRAKQFSDIFSNNLVSVVQRVSLPALSQIQDNKELLKNNYKKSILLTMYISSVLLFVLAAMSKNLILVLLGEKWIEAARFLPLLCFSMALYPIGVINLNLMALLGRSDLCLKVEIYKKTIQVIPILIGIFTGIYWMLIGTIVTSIVAYFFNSMYSGKLVNYSMKEQLYDIAPTIIMSCLSFVLVYMVSLLSFPPIWILLMQCLVALCSIIGFSTLFKINEINLIKQLIRQIIVK